MLNAFFLNFFSASLIPGTSAAARKRKLCFVCWYLSGIRYLGHNFPWAQITFVEQMQYLWPLVWGRHSPSGPSVHGIPQARILEWVVMPFSRGSSWPRDRTQVSCIADRYLTIWEDSSSSKLCWKPVSGLSRQMWWGSHWRSAKGHQSQDEPGSESQPG